MPRILFLTGILQLAAPAASADTAGKPPPAQRLDQEQLFAAIASPPRPASLSELAHSPQWQALLHMPSEPDGSTLSKVVNTSFFLSTTGKEDPKAELAATWRALARRTSRHENPDQSALCRYPARALFLESRGYAFKRHPCPDYDEWRQTLAAKSLTLVFASAYTGNAASMLGHTFLRINSFRHDDATARRASDMLAYTVGFLANPDPSDNALAFAYNGLTGGYQGRFQIGPYYVMTGSYGGSENRDLWEYDLDLSQEQVGFLIAHLWEVFQGASFRYYFLDENCSYFLLAFLDTAFERPFLATDWGALVLPLETVRRIQRGKLAHPTARRRFSLESKLRRSYERLDRGQRQDFAGFRNGTVTPTDWENASPGDALLLDSAQLLHEYRHYANRHVTDPAQAKVAYELQLVRSQLPPMPASDLEETSSSPADAHPPRQLTVGAGRESSRNHLTLGLRWGSHGLGNVDTPDNPWSEMRYLDASFHLRPPQRGPHQSEDRASAHLHRLDIISVTSLAPLTAWDNPWAWHLSSGILETVVPPGASNHQRRHPSSLLRSQAAAGWALQSSDRRAMTALLALGRWDQPPPLDGHPASLAVGLQALAAWQPDESWKIMGDAEWSHAGTNHCRSTGWNAQAAWLHTPARWELFAAAGRTGAISLPTGHALSQAGCVGLLLAPLSVESGIRHFF